MKTLLILLLLSSSAFADEWIRSDTYREIAFEVAQFSDMTISLDIKNHPDQFETNPFLPKHPTNFDLYRYHITWGIIHPVIAYYLPSFERSIFQYMYISIHSVAVIHNYELGLRFKF